MSVRGWSFVLSWSRVGINAALFLAATRVLSLGEIGLFATAFAPIRLTQGIHKAGISDAVTVLRRTRRMHALFAVAVAVGGALTVLLAALGAVFSPLLLALSTIPLINSVGAVSEGLLRQRLQLRALALRTLCAQGVGAAVALWMLMTGWGVWALVVFALLNALLTSVLSIALARWWPDTLPRWRGVWLILRKTGEICGRVMLGTGLVPLVQLAIGLMLGPVAAGAFQIATRMLELIEALSLSPLRFIALPQFSRTVSLSADMRQHMRHTVVLAAWIWGGTLAAAPEILTLAVGTAHVTTVTPVLRAIAVFGLLNAVLMPLTQAVLAQGHTRLVLQRAAFTLMLSAVLVLPALAVSVTTVAAAISGASLCVAFWFIPRALRALHLSAQDLSPALLPLGAGAVMCAVLLALSPLPLIASVALGTALYLPFLALSHMPRRRIA
ncbi:oligosaccharide flippase family protein [Tateyamaria sp. SN6-1]|uniref:oligosaccharide flippase family protein n=1 Tax=Tateyamaria sp. SN6-1 TaxID=3092148 RepID=UPI0039F500D4